MPRSELIELAVADLGPIGRARVEFGPGFNVLTGETGAGKTLLVGALSLCLGDGDSRQSRSDHMRVSAVFRAGGREVALSRELVGGRLRGAIDEMASSAEGLRARASELIIIHGQHDSLRLRSRAEALRLVDAFGAIDGHELSEVRASIEDLESRRARFGGDADTRLREIEFLKFQISDIDRVAPLSADELAETLDALAELVSLREHRDELMAAIDRLDGDGDETILVQLSQAIRQIPDAGRFAEAHRRLGEMATEAREIVRELSGEAASLELDESAIARLDERASELQALARKYGGTLESALATRSQLADDLTDRESAVDLLASVDHDLVVLRQREEALAARLLAERTEAARAFSSAVVGQLPRVALPGAQFEVAVGGVDGSSVEILFSANPGFAPGPVQALASGGELSRLLLAISLETVSDGVVAVFDEVDAGIGGSVAQQIGDCLAELAARQQVIVVTHLASVAARADRHFVVDKEVGELSSVSTVREVRGEERVSEIARMLAGESELRESRALAERLLTGL